MDGFRSGWDGPIETYSYESQISEYAYMEINFKTSAESEEIEFITKSRSKSYMGDILYFMYGLGSFMEKIDKCYSSRNWKSKWDSYSKLIVQPIDRIYSINIFQPKGNRKLGPIPQ